MLSTRFKVSARRAQSQRGNAMLEASLVLLPVLAICFALIDFALTIFIQNTVQGAVREGVRYAVTQQTGASGQDAAIKAVVVQYSMGWLTTSNVSITYYNPNNSLSTAVTGVASNAQGNICVISATAQHAFMAPIWQMTGMLSLSAASADVMEAPPNGVLPSR